MKALTWPPPPPPIPSQRLRLEHRCGRRHFVGAKRPIRQTDDLNRSERHLRCLEVITTFAPRKVFICLMPANVPRVARQRENEAENLKSVLLLW